ncbi:MAG: F0F1 ATP synthase subunit delta [Gammaproteobacteria bacterium]|nr:F0F1 ATP synthase subunit delta [Gammaproteobacteria bacterium]NNJ94793.1 F0F1 ATP synthase subunit delta [Halobacteria archaeon]
MAEALTIARPYAQAAFKFASEQNKLKEWSDMLGLLAAVADDSSMRELIDSPHLTEQQLASLFINIGGERLDGKCANFVRVLAANRRLGLLPEIATLFEVQRSEAEGTVKAELVSAFPATEAQQAGVIDSLRRRLGRDVTLTCTTDASLLGGAIIRAGDLVIDGSVRGKLDRLGTALSH